jgi:hypothetical protein
MNRQVVIKLYLAPSRRHPQGLQRCRRVIRRQGQQPHQCKRAARLGFSVCGMHGAGFAVRERRGERKSVRSNFRHGIRSKPQTIAALMEERPELRSLLREHSDSPDLMDLRPLVAEARALADYSLLHTPLKTSDDIFRRFDVLGRVIKIIGRVVDLERKTAPLSPADIDRLVHAFASTLRRFLTPEDTQAALDHCRMLLASGENVPRKRDGAKAPVASVRSRR